MSPRARDRGRSADPRGVDVDLVLESRAAAWTARGSTEALHEYMAAMSAWIDGHEGRLNYGVGRDDYEDNRQDVLLRILSHGPPRVRDDGGSVAGYLYTACRHQVLDAHRRDRRRRTVPMAAVPDVGVQPAADADLIAAEHAACVREAVERLPAIDREVLLLVLDGLDTPTIAERLGVAPGTLRMRLCRARARLRDDLQAVI